MIKFAFSKPSGKAFFILLFIILTREVFSKQTSDYFQNPVQKCWEVSNPLIENYASDNENLIISLTDGNIFKVDRNTSSQIWKISIGNKSSSIIKSDQYKTLVATLEENSNPKNIFLEIRNIDGLSGVVSDLKKIPGVVMQIGSTDIKSDQIFYLNSNSEIGRLDLESGLLTWFLRDSEIGEKTILDGNETYFAFADNSKITQVKISDKNQKEIINSKSRQITAIALINDLLFWGDDSGAVFQKENNRRGFEKLLRTGGKVSFLQIVGKNLLITSDDNYIYYYSPKNKKTIWKKRLSGRVTVKPQVQENLVLVTTNAESDLYFVNLENGKTFNQISFSEETFIKGFQIDKTSLFVQTNSGLVKFSESCDK